MLELRFQVEKIALEQKLQKLAEQSQNMRPAFQAIGRLMLVSIDRNFQVGGRPPWKPLKISTLISWVGGPKSPHRKTWFTKTGKLTEKAGGYVATRRPLVDTGALRRSVRAHASNTRVIIASGGGAVPYAAIHQFGGLAGKGKKVYIPARPHTLIQPEDRLQIVGIMRDHLVGGGV